MRCARTVSPYSLTAYNGSVSDVSERKKIGCSDGFCLAYVGGRGIGGKAACAIERWTSCAAASISRSRPNCRVIVVPPCVFDELIERNPAMVENSRSSGVAIDDAIVSGFAPGCAAVT